MLLNIRARANYVIDTTNLKTGQLKKQLSNLFLGEGDSSLKISCMSFGFKYGPATEGNLVFDVRCLPNPYYIDELRDLTGLDKQVSEYVMQFAPIGVFGAISATIGLNGIGILASYAKLIGITYLSLIVSALL